MTAHGAVAVGQAHIRAGELLSLVVEAGLTRFYSVGCFFIDGASLKVSPFHYRLVYKILLRCVNGFVYRPVYSFSLWGKGSPEGRHPWA